MVVLAIAMMMVLGVGVGVGVEGCWNEAMECRWRD